MARREARAGSSLKFVKEREIEKNKEMKMQRVPTEWATKRCPVNRKADSILFKAPLFLSILFCFQNIEQTQKAIETQGIMNFISLIRLW